MARPRKKPDAAYVSRRPVWVPPKNVPQAEFTDVEARVRYIMRLMAAGQWVTGVTAPGLAAHWGLTSITHYASEAARRLQHAVGDIADLRAQAVATLQSIVADNREDGNDKVALDAVKALVGVTGVSAATKVDVGGDLASLLSQAFTTKSS